MLVVPEPPMMGIAFLNHYHALLSGHALTWQLPSSFICKTDISRYCYFLLCLAGRLLHSTTRMCAPGVSTFVLAMPRHSKAPFDAGAHRELD